MKYILLSCIYIYKYTLSPFVGSECRFIPTCSDYAIEALSIHGPVKGTQLTVKRLLRCRPKGGYGYDPVPDSSLDKKTSDNINKTKRRPE